MPSLAHIGPPIAALSWHGPDGGDAPYLQMQRVGRRAETHGDKWRGFGAFTPTRVPAEAIEAYHVTEFPIGGHQIEIGVNCHPFD